MKEWELLTFEEVDALDRELPLVLPFGVLEAHGPQLPVTVDLAAPVYLCRLVAEREDCILLPPLAYGFVGYSFEYPGTLGVSIDTCAATLVDILSQLADHGFTKAILVSGHGANLAAYNVATARLARTYPTLRTRYVNWWTEAGFDHVHHSDAFETETAAAMGLPVHMDRARPHEVPGTWYTEVSRYRLNPTTGGVNGHPEEADVQRGREELSHAVGVLCELVRRARTDTAPAGPARPRPV